MIDFQKYLYNKIISIIDKWELLDAYSVTFFVYANEAYEYKDYSNVTEFNISLNNEQFFKDNYDKTDDGLYSEERWNTAFLQMETFDILDDEGMDVLFNWHKQEGIENIGYEDPDCYDENMRYIGKGPIGYYELLEVITLVAKQLLEEDYFLNRGYKRIPIIIQDYEFTWYTEEATKKADIHGEADDFLKALNEGFI